MKRPWVSTTTGVCVFLSGGAVLVVELPGVRIVSLVYGTGLCVRAALLSTALLALGAFAAEWERPRATRPGGEGLTGLPSPVNHWDAAPARRIRPDEESEC